MTQDWRDDAACLGVGHLPFFPSKGENHLLVGAQALCNLCPVRTDCLEWALSFPEMYGVWGGTSENQRRRLRAHRRHTTVAVTVAVTVDQVAIERVIAGHASGAELSHDEKLELARFLRARGKGSSALARLLKCSGTDAARLLQEAAA